MSLYSHVCGFCSQACLHYQLRKLDKDHLEFIQSFIYNCEDVFSSLLRICKFCSDKLRQFQLFIEKCQHSFKKLALIREEDKVEKTSVLGPVHKHQKENEYNYHNMENCIEIVLHEPNKTIEHINPVQTVENIITITEVSVDETQNKIETNLHHVWNRNSSDKVEKRVKVCEAYSENQTKPLDLSRYQSLEFPANKTVQTADASHLTIDGKTDQSSKQSHSQPASNIKSVEEYKFLHPEERKKVRNREASRRYRERIRKDPELVSKIREQQKKRQKKYYNKINKIDNNAIEI